jgi:hypothetical protein
MTRFFRRGKTRFVFIPTIARGTLAPTAAEVAAGTELTGAVNDVNGWTFTSSRIDTPDMATEFTSKIGGSDEAEDSDFMLYLDTASNPLRTTLAKGVLGFMGIVDYKIGTIVAADLIDVWPIQVLGIPKQYSMGDDPALWHPMFGITAEPKLDLAVLA